MGRDSKFGIEGKWLILIALVLMFFVFANESEAVELEIGPAILSGEYSEGGALIISERAGKFVFGGGYFSEQYCHCNYPDDLDTNIFFHAQRVAKWKNLEVGIGPAYFQNTNRALGERLTWSLSLGYKGEKWGFRIRHFSNAGSGEPNLGQDAILVGYSFGK